MWGIDAAAGPGGRAVRSMVLALSSLAAAARPARLLGTYVVVVAASGPAHACLTAPGAPAVRSHGGACPLQTGPPPPNATPLLRSTHLRGPRLVPGSSSAYFQPATHHTLSTMRRSLLAFALLGLVCAAGERRRGQYKG